MESLTRIEKRLISDRIADQAGFQLTIAFAWYLMGEKCSFADKVTQTYYIYLSKVWATVYNCQLLQRNLRLQHLLRNLYFNAAAEAG